MRGYFLYRKIFPLLNNVKNLRGLSGDVDAFYQKALEASLWNLSQLLKSFFELSRLCLG